MATRTRIRRRQQPVPACGLPPDQVPAARVPKHRSAGQGRLPRQRGAPAKNLHLIDDDDLDEFLVLETVEIQRMIRRRKRNLDENGTKVELWLRLKESDRVAALAEKRRVEAELAEVATEAAVKNGHAAKMNMDKESAGAADMPGARADTELTRQAHNEAWMDWTLDATMEREEQDEKNIA